MRFLHREPGARGFYALLLAALFALLPACGPDASAQSGTSAAAEPVFDEADTLTVYMPGQNSTGIDYMTRLVQDAGFHITFKMAAARTEELYFKGVAESSNAVFICNMNFATKALDEGLLKDNYDIVGTASSDYIKKTELVNAEGTAFLLPVNFNGNLIARPAVLVRTDLYNEYGKEIRSAQDYEDLLKWLKKKDPDTVPGMAAILSADQSYGAEAGYMALNLFMPGMGYTPLAGLCLQEAGATNFLWMDKDGKAHAFYDLVDAQTAIRNFLAWKRDGLIDIKEDMEDTEYPTILFNDISLYNALYRYDLSSYTYNAFTEPAVQYPSVTMVAMAGPNTDVTEFVRFIDWMQDIEHYKHIKYGVENVDYKWDGQHITSNGLSSYYKCSLTSFFSQGDFNSQLFDVSASMPVGAVEERTAPESQKLPLSWQTRYELGRKLTGDSEYQNFVSYVDNKMINMFNTLYATEDSSKQTQKIQETFEAIQKVPGANTAADLVNKALGN